VTGIPLIPPERRNYGSVPEFHRNTQLCRSAEAAHYKRMHIYGRKSCPMHVRRIGNHANFGRSPLIMPNFDHANFGRSPQPPLAPQRSPSLGSTHRACKASAPSLPSRGPSNHHLDLKQACSHANNLQVRGSRLGQDPHTCFKGAAQQQDYSDGLLLPPRWFTKPVRMGTSGM